VGVGWAQGVAPGERRVGVGWVPGVGGRWGGRRVGDGGGVEWERWNGGGVGEVEWGLGTKVGWAWGAEGWVWEVVRGGR
jgi:hypothetical protein